MRLTAPGAAMSRIAARRQAALVVLFTAACATGGVRPRQAALTEAQVLLVNRPAASVITELEAAVRRAGLVIARSAAREGYLETRWYDLTAHASAAPPWNHLDRVVRLRFYADPIDTRTRLVAECVLRYRYDPSLPDRDLERMAPEHHPGRVLLDSLLAPFKSDSTRPTPPPLRSD